MKKIFICMLAVGLFSCDHGSSSNSNDFDPVTFYAEFQRRKAAWEALNIDHYRFTADAGSGAFGFGITTVTVFPDREPDVDFIWPPGMCNDRLPFPNNPFMPFRGITITELFVSLDNFVSELLPLGVIFTIEYNEQYHFPEKVLTWPSPGQTDGIGSRLDITAFEDLR